jgi:hypothetical protein
LKTLGIAIATAILTFILWVGLIVLVSALTNSAPAGICGPAGPLGGILLLMVLTSPLVASAGGIAGAIYNRRKAKRKLEADKK